MSITLEKALGLIRQHTVHLEEEEIPLGEAVNRVLSRDLISATLQPPFDRSPLDGYGVRAEDIAGASHEEPALLSVVYKLYAGSSSLQAIGQGEAVRLMTGSMIPPGADCVIRQEDTDGGETSVRVYCPVKSGQNFCFKGEEYGIGDLLIPGGSRMDAASIAVAAGAGNSHLWVKRKLTAAVISTGDEVAAPGSPLPPGRIYDTNSCYITARFFQMGVSVTAQEAVSDDCTRISEAIVRCLKTADIIITTGGVSAGQKDLVEQAVLESGGEVIFHGIHMKPGMPTLFAVKENKMILGLSGNPFSAAVPFEIFMREILAAASGCPAMGLHRDKVRVADDYKKKSPVRRFLRAHSSNGLVSIPGEQSNGQMRSMIGCNCLIDVAAGTKQLKAGELVDIIWI